MLSYVATIIEIEKLALTLPEKQRATLAASLLKSLPGVLSDEDEGLAEALRRLATSPFGSLRQVLPGREGCSAGFPRRRRSDLDANPHEAISLTALTQKL